MTTNQPESTEARLSRLETFLADVGDLVVAQNDAIDALTANVNNLAEQAAADRQQAAIDRQAWQAEINRIWQYLIGQQPGNGRSGNEQQ